MYGAHRVEAIRAAERTALAGLTEDALMRRAAAGLAAVIVAELRSARPLRGARVLLVAGPGNNGGDGLYAAQRLLQRGVLVAAWLPTGAAHPAGLSAFQAAGGAVVDAVGALTALADAQLVVDAFLGIGARGGLPEVVAEFARACEDMEIPVVAVDLPSGLQADRCSVPGPAFRASRTVTFGGHKLATVLEPARSRCGARTVIDIGIELGEPEVRCWEYTDLAGVWPLPGPESHKYNRGVVGVDAGSKAYPGAAVLVALGAVYSGAGMVRFAGAAESAALIAQQLPNVVQTGGRVNAWVIGPGWGDRRYNSELERLVAEGLPVVVDADALRRIPAELPSNWLLTPHSGELARLLGYESAEVVADPLGAVRTAARETGATVLLKGATQYVATTEGAVQIALPGPAWTAQAGSGDLLAGICGTLLAAGLPSPTAALAAASLQALTALRHPGPLPPQDLARRMAEVVAEF